MLINKKIVFFEKQLEKVFFFYSRITVQKSWVKIQNFSEKNTVFALITYPLEVG
jgi:hypothetical protein